MSPQALCRFPVRFRADEPLRSCPIREQEEDEYRRDKADLHGVLSTEHTLEREEGNVTRGNQTLDCCVQSCTFHNSKAGLSEIAAPIRRLMLERRGQVINVAGRNVDGVLVGEKRSSIASNGIAAKLNQQRLHRVRIILRGC